IVSILYPATLPGTSTPNKFDLEYYVSKHIPLVKARGAALGLKSIAVARLDPSTGYAVECVAVWENAEAFGAVTKDEEIMGDVRNFSEVPPTARIGKV
ncbi:hypothetical protein DICSQDRAFT_22625, partial [Dichomitus squalens LYAD-421 SS1]